MMETSSSLLFSLLSCQWTICSAFIVVVLYSFYRYLTSTFGYFADQGIPGPKPLPIFGNWWGMWKVNLPKFDREIVKEYGKTFGCFDGSVPNLWTTDSDLIRSIFIKDFDHFINRRRVDFRAKVVRRMLTIVRDQPWKDIRSALTPAFTTGKIKKMSVMVKECTDRLASKLEDVAKNEGKLNAKKQFSAFTIDVIARCAFGMKIEDLGSEADPFTRNALKVFNAPVSKSPVIIVPFIFPRLMPILAEKFFMTEAFMFFINTLESLIGERKKTTERFNDFVEAATETILEYKKEENGQMVPMWTREEVDEIVSAQSTLFLVAGFDTTATTLTNTSFLLARNPDVQDRLYELIESKLEQFEEVNHEMILDFPYLDQVIHEVLRMYPPLSRIERECNKDVTINGIHIKEGTQITVPMFALHYDEDYYPDPEKFDPDRWSPENKAKMNPYVWMPFGMGPRNCVGMRFALEEIKIALCTLIHQFRFFPVAETPETMQFQDGFLQVTQPISAVVGIEIRSHQ